MAKEMEKWLEIQMEAACELWRKGSSDFERHKGQANLAGEAIQKLRSLINEVK